MNKIIIIALAIFVFTASALAYNANVAVLERDNKVVSTNMEEAALACNWSVTVLERDNRIVSIDLGETVPANTPFEIPGVASCNVVNNGQIYTMCTYDKTNNSVVATPLNDKILGQMSNMMIFNGNIEDKSEKYVVVTMCSSAISH